MFRVFAGLALKTEKNHLKVLIVQQTQQIQSKMYAHIFFLAIALIRQNSVFISAPPNILQGRTGSESLQRFTGKKRPQSHKSTKA